MTKKEIIKSCISICCILFVFLFGMLFIKDAANDLSVTNPRYRNRTQVTIKDNDKSGRGVIFDEDDEYIYILTGKHVVSDTVTPIVCFGNHSSCFGETYYYFAEDDAALVRVKNEDAKELIKVKPVNRIASETDYSLYSKGGKVYWLDGIYDDNLSFLEGTWVESNRYLPEFGEYTGIFEGNVSAGMSGEGVFDEDGELMGIIVAADDSTGAVFPAYKLIRFLKEGQNNE